LSEKSPKTAVVSYYVGYSNHSICEGATLKIEDEWVRSHVLNVRLTNNFTIYEATAEVVK